MSTPSVSLGVLTNGIEYRFFTDTGEPNIQDDDAFHIVRLDAVEQGLDVMSRFHRDVFSSEAIREYATELKYTAKIITLLRQEIDIHNGEISDDFMSWILKMPGIYDGGRVTTKVLERFKPIAKNALQRTIKEIVRRVLREIDEKVEKPISYAPDSTGSSNLNIIEDAADSIIEDIEINDLDSDDF
jgi:predicted type IV restriction endonuclease